MDKKITFFEAVAISWRNEWERGDSWRIIRLAFFTVWYSLVHCLILVWRAAYIAFFTIANFLVRVVIVVVRALLGKTDWRK